MNISELNIPESPVVTATNEIIAYLRTVVDDDGNIAIPLVRRAKEANEGPPTDGTSPAVLIYHDMGNDRNEGVQNGLTQLVRLLSFRVHVKESLRPENIVELKENLYLFLVNSLKQDRFVGLGKSEGSQFKLGKNYRRWIWDWHNPQGVVVKFTDALSESGKPYTPVPPWDCFRFDIDIRTTNKGSGI